MANMRRVVPIMDGVVLGIRTWLRIIIRTLHMSRGHHRLEFHLVICMAGQGGDDPDRNHRGPGPDPDRLGV